MESAFKVLLFGLLLIIVFFFIPSDFKEKYIYENITKFLLKEEKIVIPSPDYNYYKDDSFLFISNTDDLKPSNEQELLNIIYTTLNSGWDEIAFYCDKEYTECLDDVSDISNDEILLANINNFVHPFNSYNKIITTYNNAGRVSMEVTPTYSEEQRKFIENTMGQLFINLYNSNKSIRDNIKIFHDYIINNTYYDSAAINAPTTDSDNAYGLLLNKKAICSGYADTMAIILDRLDVPNIKIASQNHVWNLVKLEDKWWHLDLTWDDPVSANGRNVLTHEYFLITTEQLKKMNDDQHFFNENIYLEAK